jgi:MYXO-CTERM domain-containing protein
MKFLRLSLLALALASFAGAAEAAALLSGPGPLNAAFADPSSVDPSFADLSFADLYRLATASGLPQPAAAPAQGIPVSFSVRPVVPQQAGFVFSTGSAPQPGRWPMVLAGLAAAAWVARRRLNYSL